MIRDMHMSRDYAMWELPLNEAFAWAAFNTEMNPWCQVDRVTEGYIAQERKS